jgi:hypothetical protein
MAGKIDVSIIIVNWNTRELLRECIQSIFDKTERCRYEIIVVDNNSNDGSVEMVKETFPGVRLIANPENIGFSRANNQGIRESSGRYIMMLNSDTKLRNDALSILVKLMDEQPEAGACGGMLLNPDGSLQPSCARFASIGAIFFGCRSLKQFLLKFTRSDKNLAAPFLNYEEHQGKQEVDWVVGADLMVRKEVLNTVGLMDEKIFLYAEDWDYCYRIKQAGWKIFYEPKAKIIHHYGKSTLDKIDKKVANILNSQQYFYSKHYGNVRASLLKFMLLTSAVVKLSVRRILFCWRRNGQSKSFVREKIKWHISVLRWGFGRGIA